MEPTTRITLIWEEGLGESRADDRSIRSAHMVEEVDELAPPLLAHVPQILHHVPTSDEGVNGTYNSCGSGTQ